MANPQSENGHIDIANEVAEILAKINLSSYEWRILWSLWRKTWGWHKKKDAISITQFEKLSGLDRRNVVRTLKKLILKGIVFRDNSYPITYGFVKNYENWGVGAMQTILSKQTIPLLSKQTMKLLSKQTPTKEKKETTTKENNIYDHPLLSKQTIASYFKEIWSKYPKGIGEKQALIYFKASVKTEDDWKNINKALENYLKSQRVAKGYIQNGSTWFNNWSDWLTYTELVCEKCKGVGKFTSPTGYEGFCSCPAGLRLKTEKGGKL